MQSTRLVKVNIIVWENPKGFYPQTKKTITRFCATVVPLQSALSQNITVLNLKISQHPNLSKVKNPPTPRNNEFWKNDLKGSRLFCDGIYFWGKGGKTSFGETFGSKLCFPSQNWILWSQFGHFYNLNHFKVRRRTHQNKVWGQIWNDVCIILCIVCNPKCENE